ncbi:MAG: hypothetical protein GY795_27375 [Desulfobacterales bacterium]|nr:hypothetical protein [Desulfobacterales bacterium]
MENNNKSSKNQWIELGTIMTVLVPMFYTAGWSYAYHYFDLFNLGLMGLNIPKEYLFLYSFWVVKSQIAKFVLALASIGGGYWMVKYYLPEKLQSSAALMRLMGKIFGNRDLAHIFQASAIVLAPVVVLLMFWLFYSLGDIAAQKDYQKQAEKDFYSYPRVRVWVKTGEKKGEKEKENQISEAMVKEWQKGCYRLLLRNKDNLYLFYPGQKNDKTPTDIIPVSKIEGVRVLPFYHSCKE